jgi:hypothetical protein
MARAQGERALPKGREEAAFSRLVRTYFGAFSDILILQNEPIIERIAVAVESPAGAAAVSLTAAQFTISSTGGS